MISTKKIIEIATLLARHGAGVQEDKVNQNECPIDYSLHNLSELFYRMEGLFYTWRQKTGKTSSGSNSLFFAAKCKIVLPSYKIIQTDYVMNTQLDTHFD